MSKRRQYTSHIENEAGNGWTVWIEPIPDNYNLRCCDCGLTHRLQFRIYDGMVQFRARRDNRATAATRREKKKND